MHDPLHRLYRAKLTVLALGLVFVGLGLLIFGHWVQSEPNWRGLRNWPVIDIGSGMFTTGLLGVALQYIDGADSEVRDIERLKRVLADSTPAMRDAVINGFALEPVDLARVATPEVLDKIITNGLSIRLGDESFAQEIVADLKDQAIDPPERLHDARVSIRLSMERSTATRRAPLFVATIRWQFSLRPCYPTRRFICLSDPDEFRDLNQDTAATSAWFAAPRSGLDAASKDTFELVDFTVNGQDRPIRRATKQASQTYSVALGQDAMQAIEPVTVAYTYRTLVASDGHLLQLRVDQPTHGLSVELDYGDTNIGYVNTLDFIASGERTTIGRSPTTVPNKLVTVDFDGWVFARSGVAFVWTLESVAHPNPVGVSLPKRR